MPDGADLRGIRLRLLRESGVTLAIGSDHGATSLQEVKNLRRLGVFDGRTLLRLWAGTSAASVFPGRDIGRLEPGFEADFLSLACDPIDDLDCLEQIRLRVKAGVRLDVDSEEG